MNKVVKMLFGAVVALIVSGVTEVARAELVFGVETSTVRNSYPAGRVDFADWAFQVSIDSAPCGGPCGVFGQVRGDTFGVHVGLGRDQMSSFSQRVVGLYRQSRDSGDPGYHVFLEAPNGSGASVSVDPLYMLDLLGMMTFGARVKGNVRMQGVGMFGLSLLESVKTGTTCAVRCSNSSCMYNSAWSHDLLCPSKRENDFNVGMKITGGVDILFRKNWLGQVSVEYAEYDINPNHVVEKRNLEQLALSFRFGYRF